MRFAFLQRRRGDFREILMLACIALIYVYLASHFRTSVLRQDWWWSLKRSDFESYATDAVSGWIRSGIGAPVPYPTGYLATTAILVLAVVVSPGIAQSIYLFAIAAACTIGALRFAGISCDPCTRGAIAIFALFNPWVYTETVAGHFYMILAYAGTMFLFGELRRAGNRSRTLACSFLVVVQQIQFVFVPLLIFAIRFLRRRERLPLISACVLLVPTIIGIALEYDRVASTPYTFAWERSSSLAPFDAIRLLGYFTHYGRTIRPITEVAMDVLLVLSLSGLVIALPLVRRPGAIGFALLVTGSTVYAMGSLGPISAAFQWIVVALPQSGLFRELYDLLAYTAFGYIALAAMAARKHLVARTAFMAAAVVLAGSWFFDAPSTYTVAAAGLPQMKITVPERSRYALFPAFQPLSFGKMGAGIDPDAFSLPGDRTVINDFVPAYPEVTALASFARDCDASKLQALGVAAIGVRPWLNEADGGSDKRDGTQCRTKVNAASAAPLVGIAAETEDGSLVSNFGAGNVFFGDDPARHASSIFQVEGDRRFAKLDDGWIDARIVFARYPDIGQAFGGAATTNSDAALPLRPGVPLLVFVRGRLIDRAGRVLDADRGAYRWIPIDQTTTAVRCFGMCVAALQGQPPAGMPLNPPANNLQRIGFQQVTPFLVRASVPPGSAAILHYDVAYSRYWCAFSSGSQLEHVRIDAVTNGWKLASRSGRSEVEIVNLAAASECLAMLLAALWAVFLVCSTSLAAFKGWKATSR